MQNHVGLCLLLIVLSGCGVKEKQARSMSSGFTGCTPDANAISEYESHFGGLATWTATCNGKKYRCSFANVASCAEATSPVTSGTP
jgi:hypothetical protein